MSHADAPLTPAGRLRLIERCATRPIAHMAAEAGVSRQCLSTWKNRYDILGALGLPDRSSAPHPGPTQTEGAVVAQNGALRRDRHQRATVGRWLVRLGISRRRDLSPTGDNNRAPGKIIARCPGHMTHVDVEKVGRIPTAANGAPTAAAARVTAPPNGPRPPTASAG